MATVLVAYDTKNGSTAGVSAAIAERLESHGMAVILAPARDVRDLSGVDAVVVGAPLYNGRWLSGAHRLVKRLTRLAPPARPALAVFSLGPRVDDSPQDWERPRAQFDHALGKHPGVEPVAMALFGGADPPSKTPRRDIRDWDAIAAWADEVAARLAES
jgi:menaquinone-dependent protoporphyrinogen oxidase